MNLYGGIRRIRVDCARDPAGPEVRGTNWARASCLSAMRSPSRVIDSAIYRGLTSACDVERLEMHGRSFFSAPREHGPTTIFFLLIGSFRRIIDLRGSTILGHWILILQKSPQRFQMVKRKAEKQQSVGTKYEL